GRAACTCSGSRRARPPSRSSVPQILAPRVAIHALQMLDTLHVRGRLRELDRLALRPPRIDVALAGVVRGEHEPLAAVLAEEVLEVPRAVADVDLRVVEIRRVEPRSAGADRDAARGRRRELHQADRAG